MRVLAISDLHLHYEENKQALKELTAHKDDWLIVAGDISHDENELRFAFDILCERFKQVVWVPGNHELWTLPMPSDKPRGEEKYLNLVSLCQTYHIHTPEDPFPNIVVNNKPYILAPMFLLYDYSFKPDHLSWDQAIAYSIQEGILCLDEYYLSPDPYRSRQDWCKARCDLTEKRLAQVPREQSLVLINHFPLRQDLIRIKIPSFSVWCGTQRTESWHTQFNVSSVVTGHLHVRTTDWIDGVCFEEVSFGYPRQWRREKGLDGYLRQILPQTSIPGSRFQYYS